MRVEVILAGLGQTIGVAAFGLRVSDLHSSSDEPIFQTATPEMVGELIKGGGIVPGMGSILSFRSIPR